MTTSTQSPSLAPDVYAGHLDAAWRQLCAGKRPSADSVVRQVGGSKATAVSAMRYFWDKYVPALLVGRDDQAPDPIVNLAAQMWDRARDIAKKRAEVELMAGNELLAKDREAFEADKDKRAQALADVNSQLRQLHGEHADLRVVASERKSELSLLKAAIERLESSEAQLTSENAELLNRIDTLKSANSELSTSVAQLTAQREATLAESSSLATQLEQQQILTTEQARGAAVAMDRLETSHKETVSSLVSRHAEAEQSLKLVIDGLETKLKNAAAAHANDLRVQQQRLGRLEKRNDELTGSLAAMARGKPKAKSKSKTSPARSQST